jgi:hypothetical protein
MRPLARISLRNYSNSYLIYKAPCLTGKHIFVCGQNGKLMKWPGTKFWIYFCSPPELRVLIHSVGLPFYQ